MIVVSGKAWVIEEDPTYQHFAICYLTTLGYQVRNFITYEECLRHFSEKPDLVVLDHDLEGGLKGIMVHQKLKTAFPTVAIISISSRQKLSLVAETYRRGSDDYIEKNSTGLIQLKSRLDNIKDKKKSVATTSTARKIKGILLFAAFCLFLHFFFHLIKN